MEGGVMAPVRLPPSWQAGRIATHARDAAGCPPAFRDCLAGTIQLGRSCWLDLLPQILRPSLDKGLVLARASLVPRLAEASAPPSLSSQRHRPGPAPARGGF